MIKTTQAGRVLLVLAILLGGADSLIAQAADSKPVFAVGTASAARGHEGTGVIAVSAGSDAGTVVIVPLVNVASFEQKVPHLHPVDGKKERVRRRPRLR